jgi:colanic acid biosynthesis protein WcaH
MPEVTTSNHLSAQDFAQVVRLAPLVSIDLVLVDPEEHALLGLRNNEPAKGFYFVPGGIIRKNEPMADAFVRVLRVETGLEIPFENARLVGAYEHFYSTNRFSDPGCGTHYVVLGYELRLPRRPKIALDDQHSASVWWTASEILYAANVHENTKAYFRKFGNAP